MVLEKDFIPYEQALDLKKLGFNRKTFASYNTVQGDKWILTPDLSGQGQFTGDGGPCVAPTFSQAFRWFREKHDLIPNIHSIYTDETHSEIEFWFWFGNYENDSDDEVFYGTYEEAELECLKKLIEIVKNK